MKRLALATVAGLLSSTALVHAADIPVEAPIRAVTVYPSGASVTRDAAFTVPVGVSVIIIGNIAPGIDTSTVRVEGLADAGLEIRSVETQQAKTDDSEDPARDRIEAAIRELRDQQLVLNDQMTALQAQRTFIQNLIAEGPAGFADNLGNGGGIEQWAAAWQAIGQGMERVLSGIREVQQQSRAIDEQINELLQQAAALPQPRAALEIRIEVSASAEATGTLEATYQVSNARWSPAYDAMLTTGDETTEPSIEIIRRAEITQSTGDDWTDVRMTLSTSRPSGGTAAPVLGGAFLRVYDFGRYAVPTAAPAPMAMEARDMAGGALAAMPVTQQQAIADFGDFRANFIIPGPVSVVSGGGVRSVRLATDGAEVRLFATATPRLSEQAFLTAAFTLDSEAPLLAGSANLFRDGSYVGMGRVAFANPGTEVELGFGPDDQVRVTFALASRESGQRGLITRINTDERHYEITVDNLHSREMEITVYDRVPVSEDERITVQRLGDTTEPTETDVNGTRGLLAWTYDYEPGETREITNAYLVTWPADLDVTGLD
ncbi:MAG: mucoidy inhibitor MuiA family protein [Bauldia sp.]|nr:mucoidy inhibitor MuiA family protein [Bauldia sp.]MCW5717943.1 mucoidy inhibitor MuiA family protein [Bauldia sp.]